MTKVARKKNRKLRKQIRKTVGALFMASAIVVAAIPVQDVAAEPLVQAKPEPKVWVWDNVKTASDVSGAPSDDTIKAETENTVPYVDDSAVIYTSDNGYFQFAYVDPDGSGNKYAVILNYNDQNLPDGSLTIPDSMEAFKKYKQTSSDGYFCLVTQNDEFMFYDVYEQKTNDAGVLLFKVPEVKYGSPGHEVIPPESSEGESIIVNRDQLYYASNGELVYRNTENKTDENGNPYTEVVEYAVEPIMGTNQKPCYAETRSEWGNKDDSELYYQVKGTVTPDKPNGDLIHPTEQAHYRIVATVKYIGQQFVKANYATDPSTGSQYVASWSIDSSKKRENPNDGVFANSANITNLTIGSNLSGISDYAFQGCATLQSVSFGNNLQTIGNGAFANCIRLSDCDIPINANIQALGKDAFYNCTALTSIVLPVNLKAIGDSCFEGCTRLQTVDLCGGSDLDTMLNAIGNSAFKDCTSLTSMVFPTQYAEDDLQIGIFEGCTNLQYVKAPNRNMNFKEDEASGLTFKNFKETVPESFYFWGADTRTEDRAGRSDLHKTANDNQIAYKYFDKEVYEIVIKEGEGANDPSITYQVNNNNELIKIWLENDPVNVEIPNKIGPYGIASIGTGCFNDACTIERVTIPESVVSIESGAFKGSHNLETVIFDNAATIQNIGTDAFRTQEVTCGCTITTKEPELTFVGAMMNDEGSDTVPFVYAMTPTNMINNAEQYKSWITCHSGMPTNIEVKYVYDFTTEEGCAQMQSYPRYDLFSDTTTLTDWVESLPYVDENDTDEVDYYVGVMNGAHDKYETNDPTDQPTEMQTSIINASLNVVVPTNVDSIKPGLFSGFTYDEEGNPKETGEGPDKKIQTVVFNGVDEVEPYTFKNCISLREAAMIGPTYIGDYVFDGPTEDEILDDMDLNDGMALSNVTLGTNLTDTGKRPFKGCKNLTNITCLDSDFIYNNGILYRNTGSGLEVVQCLEARGLTGGVGSYSVGPEELAGVTDLKEEAFEDCDGVGQIDISQTTVQVIPERCFADTDDLNTVVFGDTVTNIEAESFRDSALRILTIPGNQVFIAQDAFATQAYLDSGKTDKDAQQTIIFECVEGMYADRYANEDEYWYINPEYGKVHLTHTVIFYDYPNYPDLSEKVIYHKVDVINGEDAVPPAEPPVHEGYQFTRWTDYTNVTKDLDVYPIYGDNVYAVTFMDSEGNQIGETQYIEEGKSAIPPTPPLKDGYTFTGWSKDYNNITEDRTIIALYSDNSGDASKHTVIFYDFDGNEHSRQSVAHGEAAVAPKDPVKEGYTFLGWSPSDFSNVQKDMTIVSRFEKTGTGTGTGTNPNASASPTGTGTGSGKNSKSTPTPTPTPKKYTVSVSGGSGSGSYAAGEIVAINAYFRGTGQNFDKWTTSTAGVGFANESASSTTFTMPANNVAITATYKVGGATTTTSTGGGSSTGGTSTGSSNTNGSTVQITKPGISNTGLAGATVNGATDNFIVKVTEDQNATDAATAALQAKFGDISRIMYWPMDISLYDSTGRTKIADTSGISVNLTLPIPDELVQYAGNNKVAAVNGGVLEDLNTRFTTVNGVPCVNFTATHFSPYVIYVDTANLSAAAMDSTPKTGDPIHPKWFLSIGMACIAMILFFKRDKAVIPAKTA